MLAIPAFMLCGLWLVGSAIAEVAERIRLFAIPFGHSMARAAALPRSQPGA